MTQNKAPKKQSTANTSTQSEESRKFGKLLDNSTSGKTEVVETEQWDWVKLKNCPFYAVGKKGAYTLVLCGQAVSPVSFKTIAKTQEYVDEKPWDLIMVATSVYRDAWQVANKKKE